MSEVEYRLLADAAHRQGMAIGALVRDLALVQVLRDDLDEGRFEVRPGG